MASINVEQKLCVYNLLAILCITSVNKVASGNQILLLPFSWPSHFTLLETIGIELSRRGHNVTVAIPSSERYMESTTLQRIVYTVDAGTNAFVGIAERRLKLKEGFGVSWMSEFSRLVADFGAAVLENDQIKNLANTTDLIITDVAFFAAPVIATYHKIPWVDLSPFGHMAGFKGDLFGASVNPSYVPTFVATAEFERVGFGQYMSFLERSFNFFASICTRIVRVLVINRSLDALTMKYGTDSGTELTRKSSMVLIPMDYALEYPRMDPPHIKLIGPLTPYKQKGELEWPFSDLVKERDGKILIVSLGITSALNMGDTLKLLKALQSTNYTVIMKYNTTAINLLAKRGKIDFATNDRHDKTSFKCCKDVICKYPRVKRCSFGTVGRDDIISKARNRCMARKMQYGPLKTWKRFHSNNACPVGEETNYCYHGNIGDEKCIDCSRNPVEFHDGVRLANSTYVFDILPQQKLLQYNENAILLTHCGLNSVYEALYHAKPLICIPLFGDHFDTAGRVLSRNLGRVIPLPELNAERLNNELEILRHDKRYKENIKKASERLRRRVMTPVEEAAFWIEAVLSENGDMDYLKPSYFNMSLPVYLCLDVIVIWLTVVAVLIISVLYASYNLYQMYLS